MSAAIGQFPLDRIVRQKPKQSEAKQARSKKLIALQAKLEALESRRAELDKLANEHQMVIWNVAALAALMQRVPEIHEAGFTDEIAAGLRMIEEMATSASKRGSGVL